MAEYSILLPNEKERTVRFITLFLLLINCIVFGFLYFNSSDDKISNIALAGTIISAVAWIFLVINFFTGKFSAYRPEITFIILSISWMIIGKYFFAICLFCFAIIGVYARRKLKVVFTSASIIYPSFPSKIIRWDEVSNVMLKDNILTIDMKNNKLIQVVVAKESADIIDESAFNEFCKSQITLQ